MIFWPWVYLILKKRATGFSRISEEMLLNRERTRIVKHFPHHEKTGFKSRTTQHIEYGTLWYSMAGGVKHWGKQWVKTSFLDHTCDGGRLSKALRSHWCRLPYAVSKTILVILQVTPPSTPRHDLGCTIVLYWAEKLCNFWPLGEQ